MTTAMVSFQIAKAYGGFADCRGVLRASTEGLHLEFQTKDGFFGVLKSEVRSLVLFWEEVVAVEFKGGWVRARLELVTRSLKTLTEIPGAEGCRLRLDISRADRAAARELASFASLRLCEHHLRRMQADLDRPAP